MSHREILKVPNSHRLFRRTAYVFVYQSEQVDRSYKSKDILVSIYAGVVYPSASTYACLSLRSLTVERVCLQRPKIQTFTHLKSTSHLSFGRNPEYHDIRSGHVGLNSPSAFFESVNRIYLVMLSVSCQEMFRQARGGRMVAREG